MDDLSKLSDDQLTALYNKGPSAPVQPQTDPSKMSDDELKASYEASAPTSTTSDVIKSAGAGAAKGLLGAIGSVGDLSDLGAKGIKAASDYISDKLGVDRYQRPAPGVSPTLDAIKTGLDYIPTEKSLQTNVENVTGPFHEPQTTAGKYAETTGEFLGNPMTYMGPGSMLAKAATGAGAAVGSQAAGDITAKFAPDATKTQAAMRLAGAIAGGHGVGSTPRIVTPNVISNERQAMLDVLQNENIPLTAGDRTGNTMIKALESELSPGANEAQNRAFQQAAFNRVGENIGDRPITGRTGAVSTMMNRIGGQFDGLSARNTLTPDMRLVNDLRDVHDTYNGVPGLYPQETVNSVNGSIDRVMNSLFANGAPGTMSGADYQTLRSNLRRAAQGATDPQRAEGLHEVVNSLDDAMERSIQRTNPADAGAWAQARRNYQNGLVLERWAGSANMSPATLAQAAKAVYGKRAYVRGTDDFSDLADAGRTVMKQYQDSGTPRRLQIENGLKSLGGMIGFGVGAGHGASEAAEGGVAGLLLGELAGPLAARPLARAALMNPVTQGYLSNQALPMRPGSSPTMQALVNEIGGGNNPPMAGARKAKDGKWYLPDNSRPGKFIEVRP